MACRRGPEMNSESDNSKNSRNSEGAIMGIPVFVLGASGAGKSSSLRNFSPDETGVFNVAGKPLPFRQKLKIVNNAGYDVIQSVLGQSSLNCYVIDDSQYLLAFDLFDKAEEKGYDKFTQMAVRFQRLIRFIQTRTPDDCVVYFLHHSEMGGDGILKAKTIGRMLDEKLTLEGLSSIVLMAKADQDGYRFVTQGRGVSTAKTPMGMFEEAEIDNDLKKVDDAIRAYYELAPRRLNAKRQNGKEAA